MADGGSVNINLPAEQSNLVTLAGHGFFAPVRSCDIGFLLDQYGEESARITQISESAESFFGGTLEYFIKGNFPADNRPSSVMLSPLFCGDGAHKALRAEYWHRALRFTDVYDYMPQARRDEWNESIRAQKTPDFTEEIVIPTLQGLLASREKFLAERVDGIFRCLSGEHVTNSPEGFGKRMIMYYATTYNSFDYRRAGFIHDLRCVIAKFMGRDEPSYSQNSVLIRSSEKERGVWHEVDGGALRLKLYKKGTAHIEVHPDMAWRLNSILAFIHPAAIPASFRQKPKKRKEHELLRRPLPFQVLSYFEDGSEGFTHRIHCGLKAEGPAFEEACRVIEMLGGVQDASDCRTFTFGYRFKPVFHELIMTGCLPDKVSHQYYPTPDELAQRAVDWAEIEPGMSCLEPSAGTGSLTDLMPSDSITALEISDLHCKILEGKGVRAICGDFLAWADEQFTAGVRFERVVMNPPFSKGRAKVHLEAAIGLLDQGGILVAILPSGFRNYVPPPGCAVETSDVIDNGFPDASVSVVMLKIIRA